MKHKPMTVGAVLEYKTAERQTNKGRLNAPPVVYANPPSHCNICSDDFKGTMYDAKTRMGPWANMCRACFEVYGVGLGTGLGQKYQQLNAEDGTLDWTPGTSFVKVEG
jgi:hypothetical protein